MRVFALGRMFSRQILFGRRSVLAEHWKRKAETRCSVRATWRLSSAFMTSLCVWCVGYGIQIGGAVNSFCHLAAGLCINSIATTLARCLSQGPTVEQFTSMRPCGLMDKAPDFGSGDCRFESCHGRKLQILFSF